MGINKLCPRCMTGIDDDGYGNCSACAKLTDDQAALMKTIAQASAERKMKETPQEASHTASIRAELHKKHAKI